MNIEKMLEEINIKLDNIKEMNKKVYDIEKADLKTNIIWITTISFFIVICFLLKI